MRLPFRHLWQHRTGYGRAWGLLGVLLWAFATWKVYYGSPFLFGLTPAAWSHTEAWVALALVVLIASAPLMHSLDMRLEGKGFLHQHEISNSRLQLDDGAVSALLSTQSIRTAVTTFILTATVGQIPKTNGLPDWSNVRPFTYALGATVCMTLVVSLVTTLVATLCFDHSIRFTWSPTEPSTGLTLTETQRAAENTKLDLRMKAKNLNAIGFYCLMWSLAALPALLDPLACLVSVLVVYVVTWAYYFFPTVNVSVYKTASPVSEPLAQAMAQLVSTGTNQVNTAASAEASAKAAEAAKKAADAARAAAESAQIASGAAGRAEAAARIAAADAQKSK